MPSRIFHLIRNYGRRYRRHVGALLASAGLIVVFQNCGRVAMSKNEADLASSELSTPIVTTSNILLLTTLNKPVTTRLQVSSSSSQISLAQGSTETSVKTDHGVVTLDATQGAITYTPNRGFRGTEQFSAFVVSGVVTNVQSFTVQVENPSLDYQPALAVRGASCMLCHANITGDLISDFGYKTSTDKGPDLFSAATMVGGLSAFNPDYWAGTASLGSASITGTLYVPKTDLTTLDPTVTRIWTPFNPLAQSPAITTLDAWLNTSNVVPSLPSNNGFLGLKVKSSVYIGSPTVSDIMTAGSLVSGSVATSFYPNTTGGAAATGMTHIQNSTQDYYTNTDVLSCEGDLFFDGVVWLNNLTLKTNSGCRIYSTHSVFINGPINYSNVYITTNLQISSATGVFMGVGLCIDCYEASYARQDILAVRLAGITNLGSTPAYRNYATKDLFSKILADEAKITKMPATWPATPTVANLASQGTIMFEPSNSIINTTATTYSRLLINAPIVVSQYTGDFSGVVIAEFAFWRLGTFTFSFDPVFTGVPLLPFLDFSTLLNVE